MLFLPDTTRNVCRGMTFIESTHHNMFWRIRMKTKRLALLAATGVTVLVSSMAFAAGSGGTGSGTSGADTKMGIATGGNLNAEAGGSTTGKVGVGVGANTDASAGANSGGMATSHTNSEGVTNTNGVAASDRATAQSDVGGVQSGQTETQGHTSVTKRHHHVVKTTKTAPDGS